MSRITRPLSWLAAAALSSACLADDLPADDGVAAPAGATGTAAAALTGDINARLFLTTAPASGTAAPTISGVGNYQDWAKDYHRVVKLAGNRLAFYRRTNGDLRIVEVTSTGAYRTVRTISMLPNADEVLVGEFAGNLGRRDLLFFNRASSTVWAYELADDGSWTWYGSRTLDATSKGGTWDLVTSGYLGQSEGRDDLFVYNKTEGVAQVYRVTGAVPLTLTRVKSFTGMKRTWDAIIPGNLDGDPYTDFAFYNQDGGGVTGLPGGFGVQDVVTRGNPMNGHVKFESLGPSLTWNLIGESYDTWPMTAHAIVVPGNFGGDALTDFLVYDGDPDGTTTATYWINNGGGSFARQTPVTGWQGRWTSIVPLELAGGATDLFFYTRQVDVKLMLIVDDDGGGPAGVTDSPATLVADFTDWMRQVNRAYAPAGVHFTVDPVTERFDMDDVGGLDLTAPGLTNCYTPTDEARDALNGLALWFRQFHPGAVAVYVRSRGKGSKGCSSRDADFAVMPRPSATDVDGETRSGSAYTLPTNPKLFAHELGHFFGLHHTQPDGYLAPPASPYGYDPDNDNVQDTPPNPSMLDGSSAASPWAAVSAMCDDSGNHDVQLPGYSLNPERHEIMSKGLNCDRLYRVTPDQAQVIHTTLWQRAWPIQ